MSVKEVFVKAEWYYSIHQPWARDFHAPIAGEELVGHLEGGSRPCAGNIGAATDLSAHVISTLGMTKVIE